jgi:hypothetical protein
MALEEWLTTLRDHLPPEIMYERELLACRLLGLTRAATSSAE